MWVDIKPRKTILSHAQRRQTILRLEERRRRDRHAFELAHLRRGRVSRAFVDLFKDENVFIT